MIGEMIEFGINGNFILIFDINALPIEITTLFLPYYNQFIQDLLGY